MLIIVLPKLIQLEVNLS